MIWILLIVYQIKHFVADYPLQIPYMLGKFKPYPAFILPLLAHTAVHGLFTFLIALCFKSVGVAIALGLADMGIHFLVDRVKASPDLLGRFQALSKKEFLEIMDNMKYYSQFPGTTTTMQTKPQCEAKLKSNVYFWWALGIDQMAHHLTHYAIIAILVLT